MLTKDKKQPDIQEIVFDNGTRLVLRDIQKREQGNWCHIYLEDKEYIVNTSRILFVKNYFGNKTDYEK